MGFQPALEVKEWPEPKLCEGLRNYRESVHWSQHAPILIDNGSSELRAGFSTSNPDAPPLAYDNIVARFRDRRRGSNVVLCGNECYVDSQGRAAMKSAFDTDVVCGFDTMVGCMHRLIPGSHVGLYLRETWDRYRSHPASFVDDRDLMQSRELLFETYQAPSVCFGLDALFAGYANKIREDGLVVSAGRNTTVIVPVVGGRGVLDNAKRLSWGGALGSEFLHRLLQLKYPNLPQRITPFESQTMLDNLCYVSSDYDEEICSLSQPDNLAKIDKVVQLPYVPPERPVKTQEELDKIAERKKAASQRLIEQTRMMRHEKAEQNENDLRYYTQVKEWKPKESTEAYLQRLEDEGFESEQEFEKILKRLEAAVKRSRGEEEDAEEDKQPPTFPLVDVPDADLDEEGIKEKRRQRLTKAGYEARQRARAEKAEQDRLQAEAEARELQERQEHPEQWLNKLRKQHQDALARLQEQIRVREMLPDRKSAAAQQRMKNITALASDTKPTSQSGQRRKRGDDEDTFGADDSDWAVYRDIADAGEEQEQETLEKLHALEAKLLEHDTQFTSEDTYAAMQARKTLLVTTFLRGYEPKWDPQDSALYHQVHLNVERIRVPEVNWQPIIAGVDQAGVSELAGHVLRSFEMPTRLKMISNVLVTGRYSALPNFDTRLASELQAILPPKSPLDVRRASNPRFDAWRGMQQWVSDQKDAFTASSVSLSEYQEYGAGWSKDYRFSACWQA